MYVNVRLLFIITHSLCFIIFSPILQLYFTSKLIPVKRNKSLLNVFCEVKDRGSLSFLQRAWLVQNCCGKYLQGSSLRFQSSKLFQTVRPGNVSVMGLLIARYNLSNIYMVAYQPLHTVMTAKDNACLLRISRVCVKYFVRDIPWQAVLG